MFINKDLLFLELHKTGGSHILKLLGQVTAGEAKKKHHRATAVDVSGRLVFGSIRNPWDWYVSLWAYGVSNRGAVRERAARGVDLRYYYDELPRYMGGNRLSLFELVTIFSHDMLKPCAKWERLYGDSDNPELFRSWLYLLLSKKGRYDIGEGYALSPISACAGLMTYRYLRLFTAGNKIYHDRRLKHLDGIKAFDRDFNFTKAMIRMESLEVDFISVLKKAGYLLTEEEIIWITSGSKNGSKTNMSERNIATYYYNQATIDLVADREQFLIEKYNYQPLELE